MNPDAQTLWRAPRWTLAALLACLGMLGPFSIDTYLPAFSGIAQSIDATPVQMQQTLSAYLFGFALMNRFHGALSDSFGRRPVVLWGIALFTLASVGCALSQHIAALVFFRALQGMTAGAGIVVSRAIIRDMFPQADAQRVMSQVTIFFGVAHNMVTYDITSCAERDVARDHLFQRHRPRPADKDRHLRRSEEHTSE